VNEIAQGMDMEALVLVAVKPKYPEKEFGMAIPADPAMDA